MLDRLDSISPAGGSGQRPSFPEFQLHSQDYLNFAEQELEAFLGNSGDWSSNSRLINCIAHLKRAMDCQLDTSLHVFNLYKVFNSRNLKIEKKLDFLTAAGVVSTRTLRRLNTIRNQMEHSYEIPRLHDIELYFDIISSFVAVLQRTVLLTSISNTQFEILDDTDNLSGILEIEYKFDIPSIKIAWNIGTDNTKMSSDMDDPVKFAFFCESLYYLIRSKLLRAPD